MEVLYKTARRSPTSIPQSTNKALFEIRGMVKLLEVKGEVTTAIQAGANNAKLSQSDGTNSTDICANLDITGDVVGTVYNITGTLANALVENAATARARIAQAIPVILEKGTLRLTCSASSTGEIQWDVFFIPLTTDGDLIPVYNN